MKKIFHWLVILMLFIFFSNSANAQSITFSPTARGVFQEGDQKDFYGGGTIGYEHFFESNWSLASNIEYLIGKERGILFDISARPSWLSWSVGIHRCFGKNNLGFYAGVETVLHNVIVKVNLAGVSSETESDHAFGLGFPLRYIFGNPNNPFTVGLTVVPGAVFNEAYGGVRLDGGIQLGYRF